LSPKAQCVACTVHIDGALVPITPERMKAALARA